ncbi:MAG: Gfo/Idh/MocA family oxidoreductase [Bryobacterales bacterium]|nr:Gfo/Idh/MocA family oxidoreductase [Bryobacterales bacterium]
MGGAAERLLAPACAKIPNLKAIAGCDPDPDRRAWAESRFGLKTYSTPEELLRSEQPEIALIGTPPDSHFALAQLALEHGAHVFLEKPFTQTTEEADALIDLARAQQRLLAVNTQYRYMDIYRRTRERLAAGDFGRLYGIQVWQQMFHPADLDGPNWRRQMRRATLYEFGGHALDLLCYLFDAAPQEISALTPAVREEFHSDVLVQATLKFPQDRLATLWFNRVSHAPMRYLEMRLHCEHASVRISLGGVARISLDWVGRPRLRVSLNKGGEAREERDGHARTFAQMRSPAFLPATVAHLEEFLARIARGDTDLAAAEESRVVLRASLAGYESAETGGAWVHI